MSIFSKPLSEVGAADLQELLSDSAAENARLEFKLQIPTKDETLKKLSSFANTFGGFMVVGASASSADGRIDGLPGVEVEAGYKQKVVDWCFSSVSPPVVVEVSDPIAVPAGGGKVCYVIRTVESDVAPHFLNGRKGAWVRTDEFSARFEARLANENELRHLLDRRKIILERRASLLERARKRFEIHAAKASAHQDQEHSESGSFLELCFVPRFPARPLFDQGKLRSLVTTHYLPWRGVMFPDPGKGVISQHESAIVLQATHDLSIFEANIWGMLFYRTRIDDDHNGTWGIHLYQFVGTVLLFICHADEMFRAMGYTGPVIIETVLDSILAVPWLLPRGSWLSPGPGSELDSRVEFSITTATDLLREKPDAIAMDILRYVFFSVNWPDLVGVPQQLRRVDPLGLSLQLLAQSREGANLTRRNSRLRVRSPAIAVWLLS